MHCDICAENVRDATRSVKCLNIACHGTLFQMIIPLWSGTTGLDVKRTYREGWQRWARDPKQVVLDPARENLHDIFLDPLELNSVETDRCGIALASWNH